LDTASNVKTSRPAGALAATELKEVELIHGLARWLTDLPASPPIPEGIEVRIVVRETDASEYYAFASWRWGVPEEYHDQLSVTLEEFRLGRPGRKSTGDKHGAMGGPFPRSEPTLRQDRPASMVSPPGQKRAG
jgi:hypothetical protein